MLKSQFLNKYVKLRNVLEATPDTKFLSYLKDQYETPILSIYWLDKYNFVVSTWTKYVYVYLDGIAQHGWKRAFFGSAIDIGPYFYMSVNEQDSDEVGSLLFNQHGELRVTDFGNKPHFNDDNIPAVWSFNSREHYNYNHEFVTAFITIILVFKSRLPKLLTITKIFEPFWEHKRTQFLDTIFRNSV